MAVTKVYLVKVKANGDLDWEQSYGETGYTIGYSVVQTSDGGYAIAGIIDPGVPIDQVYLLKLEGPPPAPAPDHNPNPGMTFLDRNVCFTDCVNFYLILRDMNKTGSNNCFQLTITDSNNQVAYTRDCRIRCNTNWYVFYLCKDRFTAGTYTIHATSNDWGITKQIKIH